MGFSGEANDQEPFTSQKSTRDASKVPEAEGEKPKTQVNDLLFLVTHYSQETKCLEEAYAQLQEQFYELKQKLKISHQTLEQIITYMSDGLMFVARSGNITLFNPAAGNLMGYLCETVLQQPYKNHFSDHFFGFSMEEALQKPVGHRRIFLTLSERIEVEVSTSDIPEKGLLLLLCNRTEQQKLQKSIGQAERLQELGEMAATLAHEIRNPLGGVEGFAQLLKRDLETPTHQRMIKAILEGTQTINHLVTTVLDYAKPMHLHFAPVDLCALIEETLSQFTAFEKKTELKFIFHHSNTTVSIDRARFKLALQNLLRNAHEAGARHIEIGLIGRSTIVIKDDGPGICQSNLQKIFTPFFTTKTSGTGLGLAEALAVVKAHGGSLEVSSEEGHGTQFIIKLPE